MKRILEFDALRGIASVVILIYHLRLLKVMPILGSAVDLFFVLSGFLITGILLRDLGEPGALKRFYIRRALRIWPIYYLALGAVLILNHVSIRPHAIGAWPYFLTYTPFIQAYWGGAMPTFPPSFVHTWSLAVEEQFYTLWPFVVLLLGRRIHLILPPLIALGIYLRAKGLPPGLLLTHSDGLLLGAWLALRSEKVSASKRLPWSFVGLILFGVSVPLWRSSAVGMLAQLTSAVDWAVVAKACDPLRINLSYLGLVGLVLWGAGNPRLKPLRDTRLVELGQISYGLYLYHPLVFWAVTNLWLGLGLKGTVWKETVWLDLIRIALSFAVAKASWRWIEQPLLKRKERLAPRGGESIWKGPHSRTDVRVESLTPAQDD